MLIVYVKLKNMLSDRKGVSHLLEVAGTLGLVALIVALVFPGARDTMKDIWDNMIQKVVSFTSSTPG
jgi:hypothetical protein